MSFLDVSNIAPVMQTEMMQEPVSPAPRSIFKGKCVSGINFCAAFIAWFMLGCPKLQLAFRQNGWLFVIQIDGMRHQ